MSGIVMGFVWALLLSPVVLIVLGLICSLIPGAGGFLSDIFWSLLGELDIFQLASSVLQTTLQYQNLGAEQVADYFLAILFGALSEAAILSCCIFLLKASGIRLNRRFEPRFIKPVWRQTLIGVVIGVVIVRIQELLLPLGQTILMLVICLGCFLWGISLIMGKSTTSRTYRNRQAGVLLNLMTGIVGNLFSALAGVMLLTCFLQGPQVMHNGGSVAGWLTWCVSSVLVLYISHVVSEFMKPT